MKAWGKKKASKVTIKNHRKHELSPEEETKKLPQKMVEDSSILQK